MIRGRGEIMEDYTTLNALLDEVIEKAPMLTEGSTFVLPSFDAGDKEYVAAYCALQGWECRYFPLTERFFDAVEEKREVVHRFYLRRNEGGVGEMVSTV